MKKVLVVLIIIKCYWLCAQHGYKSPYRGGLKLGFSFHTLTGDLTESRPGQNLLGGIWFQLKMNRKWTSQTELLLIDKGIGIQENGFGSSLSGGASPHHVNLHYFEIPVIFQYHVKKTYVEFGPGLGYMINYREHLFGSKSPNLVDIYPFTRSELSFNLGIGNKLNERWAIGLRFSHSLLPVRGVVPLVSKASYNRLLAFNVTRQIKKKKTVNQDPPLKTNTQN